MVPVRSLYSKSMTCNDHNCVSSVGNSFCNPLESWNECIHTYNDDDNSGQCARERESERESEYIRKRQKIDLCISQIQNKIHLYILFIHKPQKIHRWLGVAENRDESNRTMLLLLRTAEAPLYVPNFNIAGNSIS